MGDPWASSVNLKNIHKQMTELQKKIEELNHLLQVRMKSNKEMIKWKEKPQLTYSVEARACRMRKESQHQQKRFLCIKGKNQVKEKKCEFNNSLY